MIICSICVSVICLKLNKSRNGTSYLITQDAKYLMFAYVNSVFVVFAWFGAQSTLLWLTFLKTERTWM